MKIVLSEHWNQYFEYFKDEEKDIYFREEYVYLYQSGTEVPFCVIVEEEGKYLLFPFLRREFLFKQSIYYDFETVYGYGGPIFNTKDDFFKKSSLQCLYQFFADNHFVAGFVRFHPLLCNYDFFDCIGNIVFDRNTIAIDLSLSEDDIWMKEIHTKNRNVIKKAINNGLEFIVDTDYHYLPQFVNLYNSTMNKLSANDFYFFEDRYYQLLKNNINDSFLGVVKCGNEIASAAIFFFSSSYAHYHLSSSNKSFLNLMPNNFMLYKAALELKQKGAKLFHLGGGTTSNIDDSLFCFKSRFSKSLYQFAIGKLIFNANVYAELCKDWEEKNPQKKECYNCFLLKYKY